MNNLNKDLTAKQIAEQIRDEASSLQDTHEQLLAREMWYEVLEARLKGESVEKASVRILWEWLEEERITGTEQMIRIMLLAADEGDKE